jgi:uncharacterized protein YkwD
MLTKLARAPLCAALVLALAACSGAGTALSPGLSQSMEAPGAQLNRGEAIGMINHYRATIGARPLASDPALDAKAQEYAALYAKTGRQSATPPGTIQIRYSAGYSNFAETFSGWRGSPQDSAALSDGNASRAGLAVVYEPTSPYGIYWVMIVG